MGTKWELSLERAPLLPRPTGVAGKTNGSLSKTKLLMSAKELDKQESAVKDLRLADYRYLSDSLWKNEQVGETRANFFIGIVTGVLAGLVALINAEHGIRGETLRLIVD